MSVKVMADCEKRGEKEKILSRQAWIDQNGKIISFHPIESSRLLKEEEALFWKEVVFLCETGYRIQ